VPLPSSCAEDRIPARGGVGLKAEHYRTIVETLPDVGFFEVHAENYMGAGGPPHRYLSAIRERYPLSLHGVGLSIGADRPLDKDHLQRLKELIERYRPGLFSEHRFAARAIHRRDARAVRRTHRPRPAYARPADALGESVHLSCLRRKHLFRDRLYRGSRATHRLRSASRRQQCLRRIDQPAGTSTPTPSGSRVRFRH